ncbi:MAG TPA: hypothetical protein VE266_04325 [Steroidobacteraceae bacterium]|nr:hypothetical protein [Steroidobacteraceae bacterium]
MLVQQFVAGVLVIACALFAAWRLSTARLRLRALDALGTLPGIRSASWLATLRRHTLAGLGSACGGCAQGTAAAPKASRPGHP